MALTPANIYHGPAATVTLGGSDLGGLGNNNVEITFEPVKYDLHDGQGFQIFGLGKIVVELAETDSTHMATIAAAKDTAAAFVVTGLDGTTYTTPALLCSYEVKRAFGDEPHVVIVTAQKKVEDADDFITIA